MNSSSAKVSSCTLLVTTSANTGGNVSISLEKRVHFSCKIRNFSGKISCTIINRTRVRLIIVQRKVQEQLHETFQCFASNIGKIFKIISMILRNAALRFVAERGDAQEDALWDLVGIADAVAVVHHKVRPKVLCLVKTFGNHGQRLAGLEAVSGHGADDDIAGGIGNHGGSVLAHPGDERAGCVDGG